MIAIIDYGVGNVAAIRNMLKKSGYQSSVTKSHDEIRQATKIILPGVGAFDSCAQNLDLYDLRGILKEMVIENEIPLLGICVGMQLLARNSEEGTLDGLGFIPSSVKRFKMDNPSFKVPHMGWNTIHPSPDNLLFKDLPDDARFYFVHSYHVVCDSKEHIGAITHYGYTFTSSVKNNNIYGVQFHPEKSHRFGMHILRNFAEI